MALQIIADSSRFTSNPSIPGVNFENERKAGLQIIYGLNSRVRGLETTLNDERIENNNLQQNHENALFTERQRHDQLSRQLTEAQTQIQTLTSQLNQKNQHITKLEQQINQNTQLINLWRQETQALSQQVAKEREQVNLLSTQLRSEQARATNLQNQILQFLGKIEQQNATILQQQEQLKTPQTTTLDKALDFGYHLFTLQLYKYDFNKK